MQDLISPLVLWVLGLSYWNEAHGWSRRSGLGRAVQCVLGLIMMVLCGGALFQGWRLEAPIGRTAIMILFGGGLAFMAVGFIQSLRRMAKDAHAQTE